MTIFFKALWLVLVFFSVPAMADESWALARDSSGIKVWTREIPTYPIRAFKAVTVVKSSLNGLVGLLMDTEHATDWIYRTKRIDILKRDDEKATFLIHVMTDFPWPLTDRDAIVAGAIVQDAKSGVVTITSGSVVNAQYPARAEFVRMPDFEGTWTFRPLGGGMVEVTMVGRANPSGRIPAGVVNLIIHETPFRTLKELRRVVGASRYQELRSVQIKEPQ